MIKNLHINIRDTTLAGDPVICSRLRHTHGIWFIINQYGSHTIGSGIPVTRLPRRRGGKTVNPFKNKPKYYVIRKGVDLCNMRRVNFLSGNLVYKRILEIDTGKWIPNEETLIGELVDQVKARSI